MTKDEIRQRAKEKEQRVIEAICNGAYSLDDIVCKTDLKRSWVSQCLRDLIAAYRVPNMACLVKTLAPPKQPVMPKFTSHNCVIVDASCSPALAANLLVQVLGREYCSNLIDELMAACAPGEEKD